MDYKIDKTVPIPRGKSGKNAFPFKDMEVGDSFAFEKDNTANVRTAIQRHKRGSGNPLAMFVTRTMKDGSGRCWRVQ